MKEVNVVLTNVSEIDYSFEYAIAIDRSAGEINEFSSKNRRCFIFPFYNKEKINDIPTPEDLLYSDYILLPIYIGNIPIENHRLSFISQFVADTFKDEYRYAKEIPFDLRVES
jgi:hypothetical protein